MKFKIKSGAQYNLRNGGIARVYEAKCGGTFDVHGAIMGEMCWYSAAWRDDGRFLSSDTDPRDIISEVEKADYVLT